MSSAGKTYSVPSRDNNINFLRFIAASLVIWFHMASLLAIPEPYIMGQGLGPIALQASAAILFAVLLVFFLVLR